MAPTNVSNPLYHPLQSRQTLPIMPLQFLSRITWCSRLRFPWFLTYFLSPGRPLVLGDMVPDLGVLKRGWLQMLYVSCHHSHSKACVISHTQECNTGGAIMYSSPHALSLCEHWSLSTNKNEKIALRVENHVPSHSVTAQIQ